MTNYILDPDQFEVGITFNGRKFLLKGNPVIYSDASGEPMNIMHMLNITFPGMAQKYKSKSDNTLLSWQFKTDQGSQDDYIKLLELLLRVDRKECEVIPDADFEDLHARRANRAKLD